MNDIKTNYYRVLTATIMYDKTLNPIEILLYAEITGLLEASGECFASNQYFAERFDRSETTISTILHKLEKKGYILINVDRKNNNKRVIFLSEPLLKNQNTSFEKSKEPLLKNQKSYIYNNRELITESNKEKYKKEKPTLEEITKYIQEEKLNLNPQSIFNYYEKNNWIKKNGKPVINWKSTLKTIANTQTVAERHTSLNEISFNVEERRREYSDYEKIKTLHEHRNKLEIVLKDDDIKDFCIKMIKNNTTKATVQDIQNNYEAQDLLKRVYLKYLQQIKTNKQEIDMAIKEELELFLSKCLDYRYIAVIESLNVFKKENYNAYRMERQKNNLTFLSLRDYLLNEIGHRSKMIDFYNNYMFKEIEKLLS